MILRKILPNKVTKVCVRNKCLVSAVDWSQKSVYSWFLPVQTRWLDNDQYGHINNAVYHGIFDSVINIYLIRNLGLDIRSTAVSARGYMATNSCTFYGSAAYPHVYMAGFIVEKVGNTSVQYRLGLFPFTHPTKSVLVDLVIGHNFDDPVMDLVQEKALVTGSSTHVLVDPVSRRTVRISAEWREKFKCLLPRK